MMHTEQHLQQKHEQHGATSGWRERGEEIVRAGKCVTGTTAILLTARRKSSWFQKKSKNLLKSDRFCWRLRLAFYLKQRTVNLFHPWEDFINTSLTIGEKNMRSIHTHTHTHTHTCNFNTKKLKHEQRILYLHIQLQAGLAKHSW